MKKTIEQFMWAYQPHFRESLERFTNRALEASGISAKALALLVGVEEPGSGNAFPVCVEPENGPWPVVLFELLEERIKTLIIEDPLQRMRFGDEPSNRDKPIWIRRNAVRTAVRERLAKYDGEHGVRSFVGAPTLVDGYHVVPVVQIPSAAIDAQPALKNRMRGERTVHTSFLEALIAAVLGEATKQLVGPDPGRATIGFERDLEDLLREAGRKFMYVPEMAITRTWAGGLFEGCNRVSALRYEGSAGEGRMVLAAPKHDCVHVDLEFVRPVPLNQANWARKILQMGSREVSLLCDGSSINGLGHVCDHYDPIREDVFVVDFTGHYTWELRHGTTRLMRTSYGVPRLPPTRLPDGELRSLFRRIFSTATTADAERICSLVRTAIEQKHGTLVVVSDDAAGEARRLAAQGTPIQPTFLPENIVRRVTGIDGAVLVDTKGTCHAIGIILDGQAVEDGDPSRGARFNSAKRYVESAEPNTLAVVVSEDGHVNVLPALRPQVRRSEIAHHVEEFHRLAVDAGEGWHLHRNWLDEHRFYLDEAQCRQVNEDLEKLRPMVMAQGVGAIWILITPLEPDEEMNDSYFAEEA